MYPIDLSGKNGIVFGVANHRSIAWSISQALNKAGMRLALAYQNERVKDTVAKLAQELDRPILIECDASSDQAVERAFAQVKEQMGSLDTVVHSIAFANKDDLSGDFSRTPREGFRVALDISAYSLVIMSHYAAPLLNAGGSVITLTFQASERVFPGYNVMGVAKAALENEVRQLAAELGAKGVRVSAISAGPLDTLSSRVIHGYTDMKKAYSNASPLRRNTTHDDVAKTALYLVSDLSSGVTGEVIHVDTGYHIMGVSMPS